VVDKELQEKYTCTDGLTLYKFVEGIKFDSSYIKKCTRMEENSWNTILD